MNTNLNCSRPMFFMGKNSEVKAEVKPEVNAPTQPVVVTKPEVKPEAKTEAKPQLQPQLTADKVEISKKEPKCEGEACKK